MCSLEIILMEEYTINSPPYKSKMDDFNVKRVFLKFYLRFMNMRKAKAQEARRDEEKRKSRLWRETLQREMNDTDQEDEESENLN